MKIAQRKAGPYTLLKECGEKGGVVATHTRISVRAKHPSKSNAAIFSFGSVVGPWKCSHHPETHVTLTHVIVRKLQRGIMTYETSHALSVTAGKWINAKKFAQQGTRCSWRRKQGCQTYVRWDVILTG